MNTTKLPTGSRIGVVAVALIYVAAMFMLFLPTCTAIVEIASAGGGTTSAFPMGSVELNGLLCLKFSPAHWVYFILSILCASVAIPMFGDPQLNVRQAFVGIRCLLVIISYSLIAAFVLDVRSPIAAMYPNNIITIMSFGVLNLGYLVFILATIGLILTIVATVLCATETLDARRSAFFANSYKKWTPEEILIAFFTGLTGGILSMIPYMWTKKVWKRKYGDPPIRPAPPEPVVPKKGTTSLDRYAYTAKLLNTYTDLLSRGAISKEEYEDIKRNLLAQSPPPNPK